MIIINAVEGKKICLGRIGENEARAVRFDVSRELAEFPGANISVLNMRPSDPDAYPVNGQYLALDGNFLLWTLQSGDLAEDGLGQCELKATLDGAIVKSIIWTTEICPALDGNGEPPEPWESWQQQVEADADRAEAAAELLEHPGAEAVTLPEGSEATAEYDDGVFTFGIPKGDTGEDGYSPTVRMTRGTGRLSIYITDKSGTKSSYVDDGKDGRELAMGSVHTLETGEPATAEIIDNPQWPKMYLNLGLPKGNTGDQGEQGETGETPIISIGTVTTLPAGSSATASMDTTDPEHPVLSMGIPKGDPGEVTEEELEEATTELKSQIDGKADLIHDTVSNVAIASVPDGAANLPLTALRFAVNPIQAGSGDPYPAGGGKNKFNAQYTSEKAQQYCNFSNGVFTVKSVPSANDSFLIGTVDLKAGQSYILNGGYSNSFRCYVRVDNTNYASGGSDSNVFTPASDQTVNVTVVLNSDASVGWQLKPMIRLSTVSDPTFAPYENKRPITGRTGAVVAVKGKNLLTGTISGKAPGSTGTINTSTGYQSNIAPIKKGVTYTFMTSGSNVYAFYLNEPVSGSTAYDATRHTDSNTFTAPIDGWVVFRSPDGYATPMIVVGTTLGDYVAPITGTNATVQFGQTVYGCEVDWVGAECEDELTLFEFDGSNDEEWTTNSNGFSIIVGDAYKTTQTPIANYLVCLTNGSSSGLSAWQGRMNPTTSGSGTIFMVKPDNISTVEAWKTYLATNPLQVLIKKATATQIQLSDLDEISTVEGQMNLWADCGDIELMEYPCDTKLYVEKRLSASQNLMELIITANRESELKASKAYASGNLIIVNGTLYRATASIANGATLTPGTNVTATTVAAELAALA